MSCSGAKVNCVSPDGRAHTYEIEQHFALNSACVMKQTVSEVLDECKAKGPSDRCLPVSVSFVTFKARKQWNRNACSGNPSITTTTCPVNPGRETCDNYGT